MQLLQLFKTGMMCLMYIIVSGGLINLNKYIVNPARFPHPMVLTALHMLMSCILCFCFYFIKPSMYPGFENTRGKRWAVMKRIIPIGICFAIMLYGSNRAYLYCGVAFLQFMKEANVVLVFLFSCLARLQYITMPRFVVIAWIIVGSSLCVSGDVHFAFLGFVFQAISQLAECARAVMAELVLNGAEFKLDPLTYTMFVAPVCLIVLIIGSAITWNNSVWPDFCSMWGIIIPDACLAFLLNVIIALVIKEISAVGFIICGIVKDIVLVVFSCIVFHDHITGLQWISFCITLSGVFFWSFMRVAPEHKAVVMFEWVFCGFLHKPVKQVDESTHLMSQDKKV